MDANGSPANENNSRHDNHDGTPQLNTTLIPEVTMAMVFSQKDAVSTTPVVTSTGAAEPGQKAQQLGTAMAMLRKAVTPYLPLKRSPGIHEIGGIDLVDHDKPDLPFTETGIVPFAAELIQRWKQCIATDHKARIGKFIPFLSCLDSDCIRLSC